MVPPRHLRGTLSPLAEPVNGFLGVDMGIINIATTSYR